jgi:hypothetical protein
MIHFQRPVQQQRKTCDDGDGDGMNMYETLQTFANQ